MGAADLELTHNFAEIDKLLEQLPARVQRRQVDRALRAGAAVVRKAVRAAAPKRTGFLRKSLAVRKNARQSRREGGSVIQVGFVGGARQYANTARNRAARRVGQNYVTGENAFYFRFHEFGTRYHREQGFMRKALRSNTDQVMTRVARRLSDGLTEEVAKGRT